MIFVVSLANLQGARAESENSGSPYHKDMNTFFNDQLEVLLKKEPTDPDVLPPAEGEECPTSNVSTYCVAMTAVDKYDAFRRALLLTHSSYSYDPEFVDEYEGKFVSIQEIAQQQFSRTDLIEEQLALAEKTLDATLAVYNEVYLYYNLHVEYWNLIKDLEKFRDKLADVRQEVERYPGKFHNRTTTECT